MSMSLRGKRIAVFIWYSSKHPKAGGAERYCYQMCQLLRRHGAQVTIVTSQSGASPVTYQQAGLRIAEIAPTWKILPATMRWYFKNRADIDLAIDFTNKIPYLTPLYVRKPLIGAFMHINGGVFLEEWGIAGWLGIAVERLLIMPYKRHEAIALSGSTKAELQLAGFSNVAIAPVPRSWAGSLQGKPATEPLIVIVNRLRKYKRIDLFLRAFAILARQYPTLRVMIIGEGPDTGRLKRLARQLDLTNRIDFTGPVSEVSKYTLLRKAWFTVSTSRKEGWGIPVIEAARFAIPAIGYAVPGTKDVIMNGQTGLLVTDQTPEALAHACATLLENTAMRKRLGQGAQRFARSLTDTKLNPWLQTCSRLLKKS